MKLTINDPSPAMKTSILFAGSSNLITFIMFILSIDPAMSQLNVPGYKQVMLDDGFRYGLFVPAPNDPSYKYPLLVFLHGHTDTTSWNHRWYSDSSQAIHPCIVLTPKCPVNYDDGWGNCWPFGAHSFAMDHTIELIKLLKDRDDIDTSRIYLWGVSMGGFGVYNALIRERKLFAGAVVVCGGGSQYYVPAEISDIPLWILHGSNDTLVNVNYAREIYKGILNAGGQKARYTEYPGVAHDSWINADKEPGLDDWLFRQRRE